MRLKTASVLGVLTLVAGGLLVTQRSPFRDESDDRSNRVRSYRCDHQVVEVELLADMGRPRSAQIEYKLPGDPPVVHNITAERWTTVDESFECPGTARLTVRPADAYGGSTECVIKVDGRTVIARKTRSRDVCEVTAHLVAP